MQRPQLGKTFDDFSPLSAYKVTYSNAAPVQADFTSSALWLEYEPSLAVLPSRLVSVLLSTVCFLCSLFFLIPSIELVSSISVYFGEHFFLILIVHLYYFVSHDIPLNN